MAVTVTDRRSAFAYGDATSETGDAGAGSWSAGATHTATFAESTGCIAIAYNETSGTIQFDLTATNISLSDTLVYVQTSVVATQDPWDQGGVNTPHGLLLGDGTNEIAFYYSGNDRRQFSHDTDGPVGWQCFVLDGSQAQLKNQAGETYAVSGSWANFLSNIGSISSVGIYFTTLSKALGGGVNCYVDIIRYGNDGLRITGGTPTEGGWGMFSEIVAEDKSTDNLKAHGIIREYTAGIYGCQGPLTFGDSGTAIDSHFFDDGVVVAFEDRAIDDDKYYFHVEGNSGADNDFILSNSTISTAGPYVTCDFSSGNIDTLTLDTVVFSNLGNSITFSNSADATGHTVDSCTFTGCGQIDPGDVTFSNNVISGSVANDLGALLLDADGASNLSNLSFIGIDTGTNGIGHAIYIPPGATGTYTLSNFAYSGYGSTGTTDAAVYNNSGGSVTLEINGGDSPTYYNGAGSSTSIVNTKTLTVSVKDTSTIAIPYASVRIENSGTGALIADGIANNLGIFTYSSYNYVGDEDVDVVVRRNSPGETRYLPVRQPATIDNNGLTITIQLTEDSNVGIIAPVGILRQGAVSENEPGNAIITANINIPSTGSNRKLVVGAFYWDSTTNLTVSAITYDGNSMTNIAGSSVSEQEGAGNYHEIAYYYYDVSDTDNGVKTVSVTWSANVAIKAIAFALIDDVASGAANDSANNTGDQVTSNLSVTLNNTNNAWSIVFSLVDDTDSPTATGVATIKRSDLTVDELNMIAVLSANRTTTGSHSIGADYGANSKTWVAGGATFLKN
jgi:hypothetical protein